MQVFDFMMIYLAHSAAFASRECRDCMFVS